MMDPSSKQHSRSQNKKNGHKYKKIMSHVSKFLHGSTSCTPKKKSGRIMSLSKPTELEAEIRDGEQCVNAPKKEERSYEPEYSTIKEVTAVVHESIQYADSVNETPPPPPENIEELYAKVKKKPKKTGGRHVPYIPLESIPGTSRQTTNIVVHQPDINCNAVEIVADKGIERTELRHCEDVPDIETNVDELQTWNLLLKHQMQHAKQLSQIKVNHPRSFGYSHRGENYPQKQVATFKNYPSNEHFSHRPQRNFQTSGEKSTQYTHYRSLEDFSSLAAHKEDIMNKIWEECQKEIMKFQQNMEQVVEENKVLHEQIQNLLQKEAKWKEEKESALIHKQENHLLAQKNNLLLQELSALHEQKEKEVKHLSYQVQRLQTEKNNLLEKLHSTLHEKETLEIKYSAMYEKNSNAVPYEIHAEAIQENQRLLNELRKKHQEGMDRVLESCRDIENEKNNLSVQVQILKDDVKMLQHSNASLKSSLEESLKGKNLALSHLEQSKQQSSETQDLLNSLLKLAEEATTERDIALSKAEFQEMQHTQMQGTVIEHSIGIGRLQEHIVNVRKRRISEGIGDIELRTKPLFTAKGNLTKFMK